MMKASVVMAALLFAAFAAQGEGSDADLQKLMDRMSGRQHGHVAFVERQTLALLDKPLESSGELFFDVPDRLEKRTLRPKPESVVLQSGNMTIRRGSQSRTISLRDYPQFGPVIDSIRATLVGDLPSLQRHYRIDFRTTGARWTLGLFPREAALASQVKSIRIDGADDAILEIDIDRANGDRSVMSIQALPAG